MGVTPLLMAGGAFLCFEGFEKIAHRLLRSRSYDEAHHHELVRALSNPDVDVCALERDKIKGAVRTDFILSAEIIVISLGTVADASFTVQLMVLAGTAALMTVGVYGLVAVIVKLDDFGLYLTRRNRSAVRKLGAAILGAAPWMMKGLSVAGTAAMFLVGGGIWVHGVAPLHHFVAQLAQLAGGFLAVLVSVALEAAVGVGTGALVLGVVTAGQRVMRRRAAV